MKIAFRQGIVRFQSDVNNLPHFLIKSSNSGNFIDLNVSPDPCVLTFAHGNANYTIEEVLEVHHAWGPFQPIGQTQYLYWDIDILTSVLTRSYTLIPPVVASLAPHNPVPDQHWFDTSTTTMKVWSGSSWVTRVRLFAGTYDSNAIILPNGLGTQVGLNVPISSGTILLDDQLKPLRASDQTFLTSETNFQITTAQNNPHTALRFETAIAYVKAGEYIPAFSAVSYVATDTVMLGRYSNTSALICGIVAEDMFIGDVSRLITSGIVNNEQWNFPSQNIGKPLFCGATGQITMNPPPFGVVQMIGTINSNKTINVNIQQPVYYEP